MTSIENENLIKTCKWAKIDETKLNIKTNKSFKIYVK